MLRRHPDVAADGNRFPAAMPEGEEGQNIQDDDQNCNDQIESAKAGRSAIHKIFSFFFVSLERQHRGLYIG